jgi:hypothetical protein
MDCARIAAKFREQIVEFSGEHSSGSPKAGRRFLAEMLCGIQARQSARLTDISWALGEKVSAKKNVERLSRQLGRKCAKRSGYLFGDMRKGGRPATGEDLKTLSGLSPSGVPRGQVYCDGCGGRRGECLDPNPFFKNMVMKIHCCCENDNLCAHCSPPLCEYKLNANYYSADLQIWHVPGFCGFPRCCCPDLGSRFLGNFTPAPKIPPKRLLTFLDRVIEFI